MKIDSQCSTPARTRVRRTLLSLSTVLLAACGADAIVRVPSDGQARSIAATVGQEIQVTLGNVGPATYASPPAISSAVLTFLGVDVVPPFTPGGPTQRFRFKAVGSGQAIVVFRRTLGDALISTIEDTIQVR